MRIAYLVFSCAVMLVAGSEGLSSYQQCQCQSQSTSGCYCVKNDLCRMDEVGDTSRQHHSRNVTSHGCPEEEVCCDDVKLHKKAPRRLGQRTMCGIGGPTTKNVEGEATTEPGQFPWMLAIFSKKDGDWEFRCGGSLIGKHIVLTAAHCVDKNEDNVAGLKVRAGLWDLEDKEFQESTVREVVLHPEYSRDPPFNDIAILITQKNFRAGPTVNTVCIPPENLIFPPGTRCLATGWGYDPFDRNSGWHHQLKKAEVPLVSTKVCQKNLRRSYLGRFFRLHDSFMCAGGEGEEDTCQGDGGGPLVCNYNGYFFQAGIVSWGIGCGVRKLPGVYTNITIFRDWIKNTHDFYS